MKSNEIFWCGAVLNHEGLQKYRGETPAATQWSRGLLQGVIDNGIDVTGFAPIWDSIFPKGRLLPTDSRFLDASIKQRPVNYFNVPMLRTASVAYSLEKGINKLLRSGRKPLAILNYNTYPYYCNALTAVARKYPDIPWVNVVLDLDDPTADNWTKFLADTKLSRGSIFLSWWGYENAPVKHKLHLDGGWSGELPQNEKTGERILIYAGKMAGYGGINEIIQAIQMHPDRHVFFDFYGKGMTPELSALAASDKRVRLKGFVEEAVLDKACREATAFLSPRDISFQGTRMIFPSKLLFYLKYRKPIISPMLPGLSPEYKDILIEPESSGAEEWSRAIMEVSQLSAEEQLKLSQKILDFILQKHWQVQAKRMIDFLQSI